MLLRTFLLRTQLLVPVIHPLPYEARVFQSLDRFLSAAYGFLVASGTSEVGAGWNKKNRETGAPYVSLTLEAPEFSAKKLFCNLGKTLGGKEGEFSVIWNAQR